jgi:hypothetical protein
MHVYLVDIEAHSFILTLNLIVLEAHSFYLNCRCFYLQLVIDVSYTLNRRDSTGTPTYTSSRKGAVRPLYDDVYMACAPYAWVSCE